MAEKAEASIKPMKTVSTDTQNKETKGKSKVKGAAPKIENQIMYFLPNLSPSGPPNNVPAATANKNIKRYTWELCTPK